MEGEMKFLTAIIVLLNTLNLYSQADLTINLFLHTADFSGSETVYFGIDSTATDGIDPWLGESDLPPDFCAPWGPTFCAFFVLPNPTICSYSDFRFGELPFTGQINHKIEVVNYVSTSNDSIYIRYDLPSGVSLHFTDELGGILINFTVEDSGEVAYLYISSLRILLMNVNYYNVVPVEITSFTGSISNVNNVMLNWSTATETNNSGFEILRFTQNDNESEKIGFVPGFGTTSDPKTYSFIDDNVISGTYKYRLRQIDFDGSFTYSNEIEVEVNFTPKEFVLYQNYPNPFNPSTTIKFEIPGQARNDNVLVTLKVYDILGNEVTTLVNEEKQPGVYEVEFGSIGTSRDLSLPSGVYFYQLKAGSFTDTKKMILLR
jgi:hypothetical protein